MAVDQNSLVARMEKQLGRELTPSERRLIGLAEEIIEKESHSPDKESKSAGAE